MKSMRLFTVTTLLLLLVLTWNISLDQHCIKVKVNEGGTIMGRSFISIELNIEYYSVGQQHDV
jgi:hypothetical protein